MEIKSFRIKNYRSIKDSGVCYLSGDNITILAGKNESGKTAILEALEDFGTEKEIRKEAIPYHNPEAVPEIAVTFEIDKETLQEISEEIGFELEAPKSSKIEIIKKYQIGYSVSEDSKKILGISYGRLLKNKEKEIADTYKRIKKIYSKILEPIEILPEINLDEISKSKTELENFKNEIEPNLLEIPDEEKNFTEGLKEIINKLGEIEKLGLVEEKFIDGIKQWIANFVLFISFEDVFPSEVPLGEAADNELIKDLAIISDLNLELITSDSIALKTKHKQQLNVRLKEDYQKFWTQDLTNLHIEWDSEKLYFLIKEDEDFYPPSLRSKGKQWHLAFYVRVAARARENVPNIILIDEPGLFLHAKAQKDVLKRLEDSAQDAPIIFCTHSPYLIKIGKLGRIRLISRTTRKGTLISNKIHKGADKETLTPIITAIGLDLSMGLDIAKDNNVILEGITDYYYLSAFKELLNFSFDKEVHLIPSVGADKFNFLVPLMIGWGLNYCCVLDNDDKGRRIEKKLLEDFEHTGVKTTLVSKNKGEEIEDLFKREDFIKYVLNENSNEVVTDKKNSEIIKRKGKTYDKVLLSKLFLEKIKDGGISLSEDTKGNFRNLLEEINRLMFPKI
ncbi:hypothetical protein ES703_44466 [subsurface metagenome]